MDKLIFINNRGKKIEFSANNGYWVDIDRDCKGINDIENEIFINSINGKNYNMLTSARIRACDIEITGSILAKTKSVRNNLIANLNKTLFYKGVLFYQSTAETRSMRVIAETAPVYDFDEITSTFTIVFKKIDNFWKTENDTTTLFGAWQSNFEFPIYTNEEELIYFAERETSLILNVYNAGDIDAPATIKFTAYGQVENPELYNVNTNEYMRINTTMEYGDVIIINTEAGNKNIILQKNGNTKNILNKLDLGSTWLLLRSGDNLYRYNATGGIDNLDITIRHSNLYLSAYGA